MPWRVVVGGIYSPNHQNGHWGRLLSYGAPDSPVRQPRHPTVRVRPLELLTSGPPDGLVVHRTGSIHCPLRQLTPALNLHAQSRTVHCSCSCCRRPLAQVAVAPLGTPDNTVNYIGVAPRIPEGGKFGVDLPGAPDTVRWHTGQSGAPDQDNLRLSFALFIWTLSLSFYWFVLNLWHL
jgi:hypothetical protein